MLPPLVRRSKNAGQTKNTGPFPCLLFVRPSWAAWNRNHPQRSNLPTQLTLLLLTHLYLTFENITLVELVLVELSFVRVVVWSSCHLVKLSFGQVGIWSSCRLGELVLVNMTWSSCRLVELSHIRIVACNLELRQHLLQILMNVYFTPKVGVLIALN
jgi:hypothetical protein